MQILSRMKRAENRNGQAVPEKRKSISMRYFFVWMICLAGLTSCKQAVTGKNGIVYKSASEYNDYIVNRQTRLMRHVMEFAKVAESSLDSAQELLTNAVRETGAMIDEINGMPPYKGDSSLRDAAVATFRFYKRVFEKDYRDILAIRKKGPDNISSEDMAEANRIVEKISKEEEGFDKAFHLAQREYARRNNMKLMENSLQQEIDKKE